ncbi:uncharacterized protein LOC130733125 [Lotus japonicus]|uniref:uncharacterized protein LOC130733125 n=1 Tax=Lotus japonicus TaxID=34305 RepID=UPI00258DC514|nr:uncharacterized protein LOC130733125 [Lotus japonicus]
MANEGDDRDFATHNHKPKWSYDVFLCFRGEDTRYTFTGNLYNALCEKKIKTFMDHDGLKSGDNISSILKALEESRVVIVVFSKDFASSTYCLREIVKIIQCKKRVLPIFCDVDPSDAYCESIKIALTELPKDIFPDMPQIESIEEWKVALATSSYQEWQLQIKRGKYKYEYERMDKIVEWVIGTVDRSDVFLSFLGRDTRNSFVNFLHDALKQERFKINMHDEKLEDDKDRISPSLVETIDKSWLSIIVLSENYAFSSLCLDELVTILDRMEKKKQLVWPIFYKVEASDIRHQKNSFGSAMAMHENNFGSEQVQKWMSSLVEVANLKGSHLKTGYEYETIERIVKVAINSLYLPSRSSSVSPRRN